MLHSLSVNFIALSLKPLLQGQDQGFSVQQDIILSYTASNTYLHFDCGPFPELHIPLQHNNETLKSHFTTTHTALDPVDA